MEQLYISKNSENIHRGSHTHIEAPHDFSLNFWKAQLGSKNRIELNQFLGFSILFIIWQYLDFFFENWLQLVLLELPNNLEVQEQVG